VFVGRFVGKAPAGHSPFLARFAGRIGDFFAGSVAGPKWIRSIGPRSRSTTKLIRSSVMSASHWAGCSSVTGQPTDPAAVDVDQGGAKHDGRGLGRLPADSRPNQSAVSAPLSLGTEHNAKD
jgi:hypothetical protein